MGSLYRKKRKHPDGSIVEERTFWVKYYQHGVAVRESTGTDKEQKARRFLKVREGAVATGQPILPRADRVRYDEAAADLRAHYTTTGTRNLVEAEKRLKHLDAFFTGRRLVSVGGAEATEYVARRQGQGIANGTINRELAVLTKMLRLAYERGKLLRLAYEIRKQREGTYAVIECKAEPAVVKEYERQLTLNEQVLRHFTTRIPARKRIRSAPKPQTPAVEEVV